MHYKQNITVEQVFYDFSLLLFLLEMWQHKVTQTLVMPTNIYITNGDDNNSNSKTSI